MGKTNWNLVKSFDQLERERLIALADEQRQVRNQLLSQCDFMVLPDSPHDSAAIRRYRQQLRDVPQLDGFPEKFTWPEKPN